MVHPGIQHAEQHGLKLPVDPLDIPGVAEAGCTFTPPGCVLTRCCSWKPNQKPVLRGREQDAKSQCLQSKLQLLIVQLKRESSSWPFHENVDGDVVRDYYKIITRPMSLATMEAKVSSHDIHVM